MQANLNHLVIDSEVESTVLPTNIAGLLRDVTLREGYRVRGGIYAHNLTARGSGSVAGPVFVRREATLLPPEPYVKGQVMLFQAGLFAGEAIITHVSDQKQSSPVATPEYVPLIIRGDMIAPSVSLENAVVTGNIHCDNAVLKDSIILGTPIVRGRLRLENTVVLSYDAGSIELFGRNTLLVPYAISKQRPEFDTQLTKPAEAPSHDGDEGPASDAWSAWVRYFALCFSEHGCGEVLLSCTRHLEGSCPYSAVRMDDKDVLTVHGEDGSTKEALSLAPRVLDMERVRDNVQRITEFLRGAHLFDHFDDSARESFLHEFGQSDDQMDRLLYAILKPAFEAIAERG